MPCPSSGRSLALGLAAALALGCAARAQTAAGDKRQGTDPAVAIGEKLAPEHLFGNWGGTLDGLSARGVDLTASYESETSGMVGGGLHRGGDYAHSINLLADLDWGKLAKLSGFSTHVAVVERAGRNASADFLGEAITQVQEIYGSGGSVAVHLAYLYAEQKLFDGKLDLKGGRLDVGEDFDASPLYCQFMNLSVCPEPRGLTIESGFTIFPTSTWGGRIRAQPGGPVYVEAGAYQVRPEGGGRSGFNFSFSDTTGAIIPLEIGAEPQFGPDRLIGHYKVGATYNTSDLDSFAVPAAPVAKRHGQFAWYVAVDQMLLRTGPNGADGLILLAGYTDNDPRTTIIAGDAFLGLLANGLVPTRRRDSVGVQVTTLKVSRHLEAVQNEEALLDLPLSSGLSTVKAPAPAPGVQSAETIWEARYDIAVREGLHLMPDVQYVVHPDATRAVSDATVLSLRILADF